jgi:hypothetical protein
MHTESCMCFIGLEMELACDAPLLRCSVALFCDARFHVPLASSLRRMVLNILEHLETKLSHAVQFLSVLALRTDDPHHVSTIG